MGQLVSIIIPVYNVENVVQRCVESVIAQTYTDIEIIIVDDGSPDRSGEICDSLAEKDERISVFHCENGGVSAARNFGVKKASGEMVAFVDSDDVIMPTYISTLVEAMEKNNADISCCAFKKIFDDTSLSNVETKTCAKEIIVDGRSACYELFGARSSQMIVVWCKLIKKSIALDNPFPIGRKHDDTAVTFKWFYTSKTVCICDSELYLYYQNPNGIMHSVAGIKNEDRRWAHNLQAEFFEEHGEKELAKLSWKKALLSLYIDSMLYDGRSDNELMQCLKGGSIKKHIDMSDKIKYSAYLYFPKLYRKLRTLLKNDDIN